MARTAKLEVEEHAPAEIKGKGAPASSYMQQPNHFELKGSYMKLIYDSTSVAGIPVFTYEDSGGIKSFKGSDIRQSDTEIGMQVTVTTNQIEGKEIPWATLTILIPRFHLERDGSLFTTWAITTAHRPLPGEPKNPWGALLTYRVDELQGKAQFCYF